MEEHRELNSLPIIVDTDAGTDDLLALSYLLSLKTLTIEAVTVVHGLAHPPAGARNIRRLLDAAGRKDIPVFEGEPAPIEGSRAFPDEWRKLTDELPGIDLPQIVDPPSNVSALDFLKRRLRDTSRPARVLALGPLTHLAIVMREIAEAPKTFQQLVIMGGAVTVPGNLADGNAEEPANDVAEWNIYIDPHAAAELFSSGMEMLLIPLDATKHVPITRKFVEDFQRQSLTALGRVVAQLFQSVMPFIEAGVYFAWDPLAAAALIDDSLVTGKRGLLEVVTSGENVGQTKLVEWDAGSPLRIAVAADAEKFTKRFQSALSM